MKNYILTFVLAVLVVLTGLTLRHGTAGFGGSPVPVAFGTSPVPPFPPEIARAAQRR